MTNNQLSEKVSEYCLEYFNSREFQSMFKSLDCYRKNFRRKPGYICSSKHKFKDGTIVHTLFYKNYFKNPNGSRKAEITFSFYFEVLDSKTGKVAYLMPCVEPGEYVLYTAHFCSRVRERAGKDFFDVMKETEDKVTYNHPKGNNVEMILGDNQYYAFGFNDNNFLVAATFVTNDMLYQDQVETAKELQEIHKEYMERVYFS